MSGFCLQCSVTRIFSNVAHFLRGKCAVLLPLLWGCGEPQQNKSIFADSVFFYFICVCVCVLENVPPFMLKWFTDLCKIHM